MAEVALTDILTGNQNPAIGSRPGGFMGFIDRVVNPTNPLGMLGKSLAQAGGGLWGDAMTLMDRQKAQGADSLLKQVELQQAIRKGQMPQTTQVKNQFGVINPDGSFRPTYTAPVDDKDTDPPFAKVLVAAGIPKGTPRYIQMMQQYAAKEADPGFVAVDQVDPVTHAQTRAFYPKSAIGGGLSSAPGAPVAPASSSGGGFDSFYGGYLRSAEGGYTPDDGNGYPANGGVNAKYHPELGDVSKLTPDQIRGVHAQIWQQAGADKIADPRLAAVHADTAINMGPSVARGLLAQAGGDAIAYMRLRDQYRQKQFGSLPQWWRQRQHSLAKYLAGLGGAPATVAPAGGAADGEDDE